MANYMKVHFNSIENVSHLFLFLYSHIQYGIIKVTKIKNKKNPTAKKQNKKQMKTCRTHKIS